MEQLRLWREERAARQARRRLQTSGVPPVLPTDPPRPQRPRSAFVPTPAPRRRDRRRLSGLRLWPEPPRVSPVHPAWDDPTGGRLRRGLYAALVVHALFIPALIFAPNIDFHGAVETPKNDRTFAVILTSPLPPVKGQGGRGQRNVRSEAEVVKAKPAAQKPVAKAATPTVKPKVKAAPTVDPKESRPVPVAERTPKPTVRESAGPTTPPTPAPAIKDDVIEGPLLAGRGPVPGSEASIGGLDGVDFPYNYYLELVRGKIAEAWKVPSGMVPAGKRIDAQIEFRIMRNGAVVQNRIEIPSGMSAYDQAALRAIVDGRPYPPLPPAFGGEYLVVHFQFAYVGR
jgi:TonB family protein